MKRMLFLAIFFGLVSGNLACKESDAKETVQLKTAADVNVYYFHFTRRCNTCLAVEANSRKAMEALFPNEIKSGQYAFTALNLDDDTNKEIAGKLAVGGQCLLVVKGSKKVDITDKGFLNAHNPEKLKEEIKSAVDKVLF